MMGLNGTGPRDWSPEADNYLRSRGISANIPRTARPLRRSTYQPRAPRAGAWATLVLALAALFLAVAEFHFNTTTGFITSTIGLAAVGGALTVIQRIRSGHRGSIRTATVAFWIGVIATMYMVVRLITWHFAPALYDELPLIPLSYQSQEAAQAAAVEQPAQASIEKLNTPLAQTLGTVALLMGQQPAGADPGLTELANGVIVLPNGAVVQAQDVERMRISVNGTDGAYAITLVNAAGERVRFSSRDGVITAG